MEPGSIARPIRQLHSPTGAAIYQTFTAGTFCAWLIRCGVGSTTRCPAEHPATCRSTRKRSKGFNISVPRTSASDFWESRKKKYKGKNGNPNSFSAESSHPFYFCVLFCHCLWGHAFLFSVNRKRKIPFRWLPKIFSPLVGYWPARNSTVETTWMNIIVQNGWHGTRCEWSKLFKNEFHSPISIFLNFTSTRSCHSNCSKLISPNVAAHS